jgi:hypothetical protein
MMIQVVAEDLNTVVLKHKGCGGRWTNGYSNIRSIKKKYSPVSWFLLRAGHGGRNKDI